MCWYSQKSGAVGEALVLPPGAVGDAVAPQGRCNACVQRRTPVLTFTRQREHAAVGTCVSVKERE